MSVRWHQEYDGGRIVARLGNVEIGAVFPGQPVRWMFWGCPGAYRPQGKARTELSAKSAILNELADFMRAAGLVMSEDGP